MDEPCVSHTEENKAVTAGDRIVSGCPQGERIEPAAAADKVCKVMTLEAAFPKLFNYYKQKGISGCTNRDDLEKTVVSLAKCETYEQDAVDSAVRKCFDNIGGLSKFISPGQKVLIKVNLLVPEKPEKAVTTHPAVVEAIAKQVLEIGAFPSIGDSAGPYGKDSGFYTPGYTALAEKLNIPITVLETPVTVSVPIDIKPRGAAKIVVAKELEQFDVIINAAKFKTHSFQILTLCIKNMFGVVPGMIKGEYHLKLPEPDDFANMCIDLYETIKPAINIIDGVVGQDGYGPRTGRVRNFGVLIASASGHHADAVAARLTGTELSYVPTLRNAVVRNLLPPDPSAIRTAGVSLEELRIKEFLLPAKQSSFFEGKYVKKITKSLRKFTTARPVIDKEKCILCRKCIEFCPAFAMYEVLDQVHINNDKCIRCYCCDEICPQGAVELHYPFLQRLFFGKN
ncbi:MAG: DUF362 domain-containing protein [Thermoplasmata archaeon]